ncbi:hypothetical protein H4Q26_008603 [Puccinia striiformis f. sp. tritici PST-130]|nr:hypothetical protein H4Q26_008603 [Puccinia striiformis f. sp. tritici PST-130]
MNPATRSNDEENRPPADSTPVDRSDANAADSSPIPSDLTSVTVQADIARAAREMLSRYPIGTTLMRADFTESISNLSIGDPHPTGEFNPLEPFHQALSLLDRGLVQSANMNASSSSSPQLLRRSRPTSSIGFTAVSDHLFKDIPYTPPPSLGTDQQAAIPSSSGPAAAHANTLRITTPSLPSNTLSTSSNPLLKTNDPAEIKSFYSDFVTQTLQLKAQQHQQQQQQQKLQRQQQQPLHQQQQVQNHASQAQPHPTSLPTQSTSLNAEDSSLSNQSLEDDQRDESPDPLAMNLATRDALKRPSSAPPPTD